MTFSQRRIAVIGGGSSGGHVMPVLAIALALKEQGAEVVWFGDRGGLAEELAQKHGVSFESIFAGKLRRYFSLANLATPFLVCIGFVKAWLVLRRFRPHILFSKGGNISLPVTLAGWALGIPLVIHESDAVLGLSNRLAAKIADAICVHFPKEYFSKDLQYKLHKTGIPLRSEMITIRPRSVIEKPFTLVVTGGAQGSRALNRLVLASLSELLALGKIIHLTGISDYEQCNAISRRGYQVFSRVDAKKMAEILGSASIVMSRASATTLAELAALGRPALLVPLPSAANDHQRANAHVWAEMGAAMVFEEADLSADRLVRVLKELATKPQRLQAMHTAAGQLFSEEATERVLDVLREVILTSEKR